MLNDKIYYTTMGIYGVNIYTYINKECTILFKQQFNTLMTNEMMEEAKVFYANLDENSKKNVKIKIYTKSKSIDNTESCMIWFNISLNNFIIYFGV